MTRINVPMPTDGKMYQWDEAAGAWTEIIEEQV